MGAMVRIVALATPLVLAMPPVGVAEDAASTAAQPYFDAHVVDLTELLPPPSVSATFRRLRIHRLRPIPIDATAKSPKTADPRAPLDTRV